MTKSRLRRREALDNALELVHLPVYSSAITHNRFMSIGPDWGTPSSITIRLPDSDETAAGDRCQEELGGRTDKIDERKDA
jgi:hypothetical protein